MNTVIYILLKVLVFAVGFVVGYLYKKRESKKADGILHIDMSGEKDNYLFEVTTPWDDMQKCDYIKFNVKIEHNRN